MTVIRVGATQKYAEGWELAFGKGRKKAGGTAVAVKKKKRKAKR